MKRTLKRELKVLEIVKREALASSHDIRLCLVVDTEINCGPDRKTVSGRGRVAAASCSLVWVRVNSDRG
jgi:hypothetical protein